MKNKLRIILTLVFMVLMFSLLSISASAYGTSVPTEPDGGTITKYEFDESECNRTIVFNIYDEDTGALIKKVNVKTKRGEDTLDIIKIYGYRATKFSSDQGLLETCKMDNSNGLQIYGNIYYHYCFRSGLSKETLTVTVYMDKFNDLTLIERHIKQEPYGDLTCSGYPVTYSRTITTNTGRYVSMGGAYSGFEIRSGWQQYISGDFTYKWLDDYENIGTPISSMEWDVIQATCEDKTYNEFDEDIDGHWSYCDNRTMNCDFEFLRNKYTISFSANGGSGSVPTSQTQYYDYDVTIGTEVPTRSGYDFKGWSKSSSATVASYQPGSTYTMGSANRMLYAVWDKRDYEFSISNLQVIVPNELFPYTTIPVRVRADSWDLNDPYDDIPVQLYFDGQLLASQHIDFAAYGVAFLDFNLNVGSSIGTHEIEVRINWNNKSAETDPNNNCVKTTITIISDSYGFRIESLMKNASYKEGTDVITSYIIYNDSERIVLPETNATAKFTAYYYKGNSKVTITNQTWNSVVIPVGESNLVYFKWSVPNNLEGVTVYCECSINLDGKLKEGNTTDNTATLSTVIADRGYSQTTNPGYTDEAPNSYYNATTPSVKNGSASWTMWEYQNDEFVEVRYGLKLSITNPLIRPGETCETAIYSGGSWTMKSGYGISMMFAPYITSLSGSSMPDPSAYTDIQTVYATFPENMYSASAPQYRTLEYYDEYWGFVENSGADGYERLHYIPVWVKDGNYSVAVTTTDVWTPAGLVSSVRNSNIVTIDGNIFDDYYVGG